MSRFEVDSAQVARAAVTVQGSAERIRAEVDHLLRQLVDLQGTWQGQAAASFQQVIRDWQATQERVHACLEDVRRALAAAGQQYAEAEASAARLFRW